MKTRYYVCGIGYNENNCVTDHEQSFGDFDTYDEARDRLIELMSKGRESFFTDANDIYQLCVQIEECEETEDETNCVDILDEWWFVNMNYKKGN